MGPITLGGGTGKRDVVVRWRKRAGDRTRDKRETLASVLEDALRNLRACSRHVHVIRYSEKMLRRLCFSVTAGEQLGQTHDYS